MWNLTPEFIEILKYGYQLYCEYSETKYSDSPAYFDQHFDQSLDQTFSKLSTAYQAGDGTVLALGIGDRWWIFSNGNSLIKRKNLQNSNFDVALGFSDGSAFRELLTGCSPAKLFMEGKMEISGYMDRALKLQDYFDPAILRVGK